jgi:MGT family glycosyltransferase
VARFLFFAIPLSGHVLPGLLVAQWLVEAGHEVRWYSTSKWRGKIEAIGAEWIGVKRAKDYDDSHLLEAFPALRGKTGMAMVKAEAHEVFLNEYPAYIRDLQEILEEYPADAMVADSLEGIPGILREMGGPPWAIYNISINTISGAEVPPIGLDLSPDRSTFGQVRNRALHWLVKNVLFRDFQSHYNQIFAEFGLKPLKMFCMDHQRDADLLMMTTVPSFEYPRMDMGNNYHFVGPLIPPPPTTFSPPAWWHELESGKKVVHVTQGTMANHDFTDLLIPALNALTDEGVLVVATTGRPLAKPLMDVLPANVRIEPFLPYAMLLPYVDVMVSNGGFGGCQWALKYGVPMVVAGRTEDKIEVSARVAYSGLGINLKTQTPTEAQIRTAVRTVLNEPTYKQRAQVLAAEAATYDTRTQMLGLLEGLVQQKMVPA